MEGEKFVGKVDSCIDKRWWWFLLKKEKVCKVIILDI